MIPDRPSARDLLETAAAELKQASAAGPSGEDRLTLLMAVAAIEMAVREQQAMPALEAEQAGALATLSPSATDPEAGAQALCGAIRTGAFDAGDGAVALHQALLADVRARAAISNPRYLAAAEEDWARRSGM